MLSMMELDPTCEITLSEPVLTCVVAIQASTIAFFSVTERDANSPDVPLSQRPLVPVATK